MPKLIAQNGDEGIFQDEQTGAQFSVYLPGLKNPPSLEQDLGYPVDANMSRPADPAKDAYGIASQRYDFLKQQGVPVEDSINSGLMKQQIDPGLERLRAAQMNVPMQSTQDVVNSYQPPAEASYDSNAGMPNVAKANEDILSKFKIDTGEDRLARGFDLMRDAEMKTARAKANYMNESANLMAQSQKTLDAIAAQEAEKRQRWQERSEQIFSAIQKSVDDVRNTKIDPWANASTGQKVAASIAIVLGAVGQSLKGGKNLGLEVINQQIDREIDLQKANLQNKKDYTNSLANSYRIMREMGADDMQATAAMKIAALEKVKMKMEQMAYASGSQEAIQAARKNIGQLDIQQGQLAQSMMAQAQDQLLKQYKPERIIPGLGVAMAGSDADVSKFRETYGDMISAKSSVSDLLSLTSKGLKSVTPELVAQADVLVNALKGQMRTAIVGPGAMSESDVKILENVIANPTKLLTLDSSNKTRLQTLLRVIDRKIGTGAKLLGLDYKPSEITSIQGKGAFERVE